MGSAIAEVSSSETYTTATEFSDWFNLSISGLSKDTAVLQRRFGSEDEWKLVKTYFSDKEERIYEPEEGVEYRLGVAEYTQSNTINLRLSN